ncbi:MAG: hypothetical protein WD768_13125 [Phycisphaeraceae bacterium]
MFQWWLDLPWWLRYGVALGLLLISTLLFFFANTVWPWGWVAGGVLLVFSSPSDSEKNGYKF